MPLGQEGDLLQQEIDGNLESLGAARGSLVLVGQAVFGDGSDTYISFPVSAVRETSSAT